MKINSDKFKKALYNKGLSQKEFAHSVGVNENTLRQWIFKGAIPDKYTLLLKETFSNDYELFTNDSKQVNETSIPYFDIDVTAGILSLFEDESTEHPTAHVQIPGLVADFVVPVHGHSMHPVISSGDWIAVKRINDLDWINFGHNYLVVTDEQRMVKVIKRHIQNDKVILMSCNDDFDDIDLPVKKIKQLFMIVQVLKRETM